MHMLSLQIKVREGYPVVTSINSVTDIPIDTPVNTPTNVPVNPPTNITTSPPTNVPTNSPSLTSQAVTDDNGEESLDDLTAFLPLQDCFLNYAFQVEKVGQEDNRTSYKVNGNYDLNSDGKEDSIIILQKGRNNNLSYIEVNRIKLSFNMDNPNEGEVHIIDLDKNDPYLDVACFDDGPSGDPEFIFFRYDGKSIYELGRIDAYASIDGKGRLISSFHRSDFKPNFCSAWYEIINNIMVRKNNPIDKYLGKIYDFTGGDAYFLPYDKLPDLPDIQWDEMIHFEACEIKLIDIWDLSEVGRTLNYYFIEFPTGERGLIYFWIGD
jgi:hypothetical protein